MNSSETADALAELKPTSKAARFRLFLPSIEAKIKAGVEHAQIIRALAMLGVELTPGTYFNYLKRSRTRAARAKAPAPHSPARTAEAPPQFNQPQRPRPFEWDPRGNPDLLK